MHIIGLYQENKKVKKVVVSSYPIMIYEKNLLN
nr:MAG TPA: hypothetical protein [Caudoviricetes sp.]